MYVQGLEVLSDTDDAGRLVECMVRRFTGDATATPDSSPGILEVRVQAPDDRGRSRPGGAGAVPALVQQVRDECAAELGISEPWELVSVLRA
jgi:hypothetical protein